MPVALVILLLDITLIYHASRTGRLQPWAFIILMVPFVGALAYICVELVPEWFSSPGARQARQRVANRLDPDKRYRELSDRLADTDTIANRAALAAECQKVARFDEAERHYDHILTLPMGDDPQYALGKAQAQSPPSARPMRWRRSTICKSAGRISSRPTAICSMPVRSPKSGASTRRSKSTMPCPPIFPVPRHGSATACCCAWLDERRKRGWCSTNCCCR